MATKTKTTVPVLTLDHFGVEHNIPFTSISEIKVGAFTHANGFTGQVLLITNTGKEYYFFQKVDASQEVALENANDAASGLKGLLGWTTSLTAAVSALV